MGEIKGDTGDDGTRGPRAFLSPTPRADLLLASTKGTKCDMPVATLSISWRSYSQSKEITREQVLALTVKKLALELGCFAIVEDLSRRPDYSLRIERATAGPTGTQSVLINHNRSGEAFRATTKLAEEGLTQPQFVGVSAMEIDVALIRKAAIATYVQAVTIIGSKQLSVDQSVAEPAAALEGSETGKAPDS